MQPLRGMTGRDGSLSIDMQVLTDYNLCRMWLVAEDRKHATTICP
jgi:hypothetical protein